MCIYTVQFFRSLKRLAPVSLLLLAACSSGGGSDTPATVTYSIGGSISGLIGTVVLQNNGGDNLSVSADGTFTFATRIATGSAYNVSVLTQPTGQTCSASANAGTASADVTTVVVTCSSNPARTIGGSVTGLTGTGLVLQNNGGDDLPIGAAGPFAFTTPVADGGGYIVSVKTQPSGQSCTVTNASGTAVANVTNVVVTCSTITYAIKAAISGLAGTVVLQNNGKDNYSVSSNLTITFLTRYSDGAAYNVTVLTQPSAQTCTVNGGTGTVAGADVTVPVICSSNTYSVGGSVAGLTGTVQLRNSATNELFSVNSPASTFTFLTKIAQGSNSVVTVNAQPLNQYCTVTNGIINSISGNVSTVAVNCVPTHTIGGNIFSNNNAGGGPTLQNNGGDALAIDAITTTPTPFTFATQVPEGGTYAVTQSVRASGPSQNCVVTGGDNGSGGGTVAAGPVTSVLVTCTNINAVPKFALVANSTANTVFSYTIGGTGALTQAGTAIATESEPYAVAVEPSGKYAYVVNRTAGSISAYIIDTVVGSPTYGQLTVADLNGTIVNGAAIATVNTPMSISIHPSGKFMYVLGKGNLDVFGGTTPSAIAAYSLDAATTFALAVIDLAPFDGNKTTLTPGLLSYAIVADPSGRFVYVTNYGDGIVAGTVSAYTVDQTSGALTSVGDIAAGVGPSSVAVDPRGNCALVTNNVGNSVSAYSIDQTTGALTAVTGSPYATGAAPRSVAIDPVNGLYAYVANAGGHPSPGQVSGYAIDPATCALATMDTDAVTGGINATINAGVIPFSVSIDPTARYVYVTNLSDNTVSTYSIGTGVAGGALTPVGTATATGTGPASVTTVAY